MGGRDLDELELEEIGGVVVDDSSDAVLGPYSTGPVLTCHGFTVSEVYISL